ncbi:MAG: hypothetical protein ACKPKO_25945, partial [Candidatus Fonsibacter sp.]
GTGVAVVPEDMGGEGLIQNQAASVDDGTGAMVEAGYMSGEYSALNHAAIVGVVIGCMSGEGINMNQAAIADEGAGVMVEPGCTSGGD